MRHTSNTNKTQAGALVELSPEVTSVITKLSEFAATYAELTSEFNSYIKDKRHLFTGEMIEFDLQLEGFDDSTKDAINDSMFFAQLLIRATHLNKN